eukprot:320552-Chlamydomonas_euryale.AAC.3
MCRAGMPAALRPPYTFHCESPGPAPIITSPAAIGSSSRMDDGTAPLSPRAKSRIPGKDISWPQPPLLPPPSSSSLHAAAAAR